MLIVLVYTGSFSEGELGHLNELDFLHFTYRSVNLSNIALFLNVEYLATVPMFPKCLLFSLLQQENHSNIIHSTVQGDYRSTVILQT